MTVWHNLFATGFDLHGDLAPLDPDGAHPETREAARQAWRTMGRDFMDTWTHCTAPWALLVFGQAWTVPRVVHCL